MLELVMNLVRWPFRLVRNNAAETISEIRDDSVNKDRVYTIMNIVSLLPLITAVVVFLVAMISFTVNSGFAIQIDMVKKDFFGSLSDIWTSGTSGYFYNMWLCLAVGISYLVICSAAVIDAYRGLDGKGKVFLTVILVLFNTVFGTFYFVAENDTKVFNFMQDLFGLGRDTCTGIMIGLFIATIVLAVVCTWFLAAYRPLLSGLINTVFYYLAAPLCCVLVQNIIGVVIAVILFGLCFFFGSAVKGIGEGSSAPSAGTPSVSKSSAKKQQRIKTLEKNIEGRNKAVRGHNRGEIGYFGVDAKACASANNNDMAEINRLKAEM